MKLPKPTRLCLPGINLKIVNARLVCNGPLMSIIHVTKTVFSGPIKPTYPSRKRKASIDSMYHTHRLAQHLGKHIYGAKDN